MQIADTLDQNISTALCPSSNMAQEIKRVIYFANISKFLKNFDHIFFTA